jgi:hypothetical protein
MADIQSGLIQVLASGAIGAGGALLGQHLANRSARSRQSIELQHRREEMWTSFILPAANARWSAVEEIYDILQEAIERRGMTRQQYERSRRRLMYVPDVLRLRTVKALTELIRARNDLEVDTSIEKLRNCQGELRKTIGLQSIEFFVSTLISSYDDGQRTPGQEV